MAEIIFIVFPSPISHINGDIADTGIFVVDQRKSDLQNSLFMILNHGQGSNIDFGKYFKNRPPEKINSIRLFLLLDFAAHLGVDFSLPIFKTSFPLEVITEGERGVKTPWTF